MADTVAKAEVEAQQRQKLGSEEEEDFALQLSQEFDKFANPEEEFDRIAADTEKKLYKIALDT